MERFDKIGRTIQLQVLIPKYRADLEGAREDLERLKRKYEALHDFDVYTPEELCPGIEAEGDRADALVRAYEKKLAALETEFRDLGY